jgi:hypothetical protein
MREVHFVQQASAKLKESRRHGVQERYNNTNFLEGPGQTTTNSSPLKQTIHSQYEVLHQGRRCGASTWSRCRLRTSPISSGYSATYSQQLCQTFYGTKSQKSL